MTSAETSTPMSDMTDQPQDQSPGQPQGKASIWRVVKDQRKVELVALAMIVASFWIVAQVHSWALASCIAAGVGLGLVNHLATEYWLLKLITSGEQPTRNQMIMSTIVRLTFLTVVAIAAAVIFWPDGIGLLL